jgi:hypothetical protein
VELTPIAVKDVEGVTMSPAQQKLEDHRFVYIRVGYDKRVISMGPGGLIVEGSGGMERYWWLDEGDDEVVVSIGPEPQEPICRLTLDKGDIWRGEWLDYEKMPVELVEIP